MTAWRSPLGGPRSSPDHYPADVSADDVDPDEPEAPEDPDRVYEQHVEREGFDR
ncbi:hypothetical protein [Halovivax cerinus]|uniref:Uncharacterized protein n=1 Tax=Halovivax cerinus TaxID=1487865 RepID=A0ABD5NLW8_9EURY|nr:hypothetical protein [Halovivax cerinus]